MLKSKIAALITAVAAISIIPSLAQATLTLTSDGTTLGFSITTFATVNPGNRGCCNGPFGLAVAGNGDVLVSSNGTRYEFDNSDGQTQASALHTVSSNSGTAGYASAGGLAYGADSGRYVQFNNDGTVNHILTGVTPSPRLGMWGAPNGHIIAASGSGLIDIDPLANGGAGSYRVISGSEFPDGVSVSPDGKTVFMAVAGGIQAIDVATGALGTFFSLGGSVDGTGVIIGGPLNGNFIVNANSGDVSMWDFSTSKFLTIATGSDPYGADRGDYTAPDMNGCVFLDEGDRVDRLCVQGGSIGGGGGGPQGVPTPGSLGLLLLGLGLGWVGWRFRSV